MRHLGWTILIFCEVSVANVLLQDQRPYGKNFIDFYNFTNTSKWIGYGHLEKLEGKSYLDDDAGLPVVGSIKIKEVWKGNLSEKTIRAELHAKLKMQNPLVVTRPYVFFERSGKKAWAVSSDTKGVFEKKLLDNLLNKEREIGIKQIPQILRKIADSEFEDIEACYKDNNSVSEISNCLEKITDIDKKFGFLIWSRDTLDDSFCTKISAIKNKRILYSCTENYTYRAGCEGEPSAPVICQNLGANVEVCLKSYERGKEDCSVVR